MNSFDEATLRLKQQLGVVRDRDVGAALGLSPTAWAGRKKRANFPETELYALHARCPELGLDVGYVLTGEVQKGRLRQRAEALAAHAAAAGNEAAADVATTVIRTDADRERARADRYRSLREAAADCDDERLALLIEVAKSFSLATLAAQAHGRAKGEGVDA